MQRYISMLLLLLHVNACMFFPAVEEKDLYTKKGKRIDDVNSVLEFVWHYFSTSGNDPIDEDDDQARYGILQKLPHYIAVAQVYIRRKPVYEAPAPKAEYVLPPEQKLPVMAYDITGPPPKA